MDGGGFMTGTARFAANQSMMNQPTAQLDPYTTKGGNNDAFKMKGGGLNNLNFQETTKQVMANSSEKRRIL
jgi:hypothetical protein